MSAASSESERVGSAVAGSARSLFDYEIRRDGRVVATLQGLQTQAGVTVETSVFPVTASLGDAGLSRPFTFGSVEHARRFADEAVVVFEYLNCTLTGTG